MTDSPDIRRAIQSALAGCAAASDFAESAECLLNTLGYKSERTHPAFENVQQFIADFPASQLGTETEKQFIAAARSAQIVFQYTKDEIAAAQQLLFHQKFDSGNAKSFLFFAVELKTPKQDEYARGEYAAFAREINKRLIMPAVVLFRVKQKLTLAFVGRRAHKKDSGRNVLEKVSLLRGINCSEPHRGHLDILASLSLPARLQWMHDNKKEQNFDGLLAAWLDELNTDALNKRFYNDLLGWFERARAEDGIQFPPNLREKREDWIIRLITRLLFVWFIKEKELVNETLFIEETARRILKNYDRQQGDSYYRVVLQNLFFATLNTPIPERKFSPGGRDSHRDFSLYRYQNEIADGRQDDLCKLFAQTPFINGGLFDCLDDYDSPTSARNSGRKNGGERIDYFSDAHGKKLSVPNTLFFGDNGIVKIFGRYKFTVEENTPVEQEVALDPELLGRVFENLLASYNPETRETARKQTGSFYTPREIVDYMVRESLSAHLTDKASPQDGDKKRWRDRLDYLLDYRDAYDDAEKLFEDSERESITRAIAGLRLLDPAVGSGAFLMGALHLLTLALNRIDPENKHLKARAFEDPKIRERAEKMVEDVFSARNQYNNYGRKLFLIQNSIFGADIQPVACQIAKLRFFISLAIEQQAGGGIQNNFGIKPLPNLETRFVAADALMSISDKGQKLLAIEKSIDAINTNRERYFNAERRDEKLQCRARDSELRRKLADKIKEWLGDDNAQKIAQWNPYDQNARAEWFDGEYMFGVADGFDIVIGNPPYVQLQKDGGQLGHKYEAQGYDSFARRGDLYMLFYERGLRLCRKDGALMFITSNSWMRANYGANLRGVLTRHNPRLLINMGGDVFDTASVSVNILLVQNSENRKELYAHDFVRSGEFPPHEWHRIAPENNGAWVIGSAAEDNLRAKIAKSGVQIKDWNVRMLFGVKTGYNRAFVINTETKNRLCAEDPKSAELIKPTIRGKNIGRYSYKTNEWVIATSASLNLSIDDYPAVKAYLQSFGRRLEQSGEPGCRSKSSYKWFETQRPFSYYPEFEKEKLLWPRVTKRGRFVYDDQKMYPLDTAWIMVGEDIQYLLAILNSRLVNWYMPSVAPNTGDAVLMWLGTYVEKLPVPQISKAEQRPFIQLAQKITAAKAANPAADTTEWEAEIDRRVYKLYNLTQEEIAAIESADQPPPKE